MTTDHLGASATLIMFSVGAIFFVCIRIMFFMQIFPNFSQLVKLVYVTVYRIRYFMMFYIFWIMYFAAANYILGSQISRGDKFHLLAEPGHANTDDILDELSDVGNDYSDVTDVFAYIILAWRNSIGDLSTPVY